MTGEFGERLRRYFEGRDRPGVVAVYLFGSQAEGRSHRESDVDIGVLLSREAFPDPSDRFEARVRLGSELIDLLDMNEVDVVILNDAPPTLGREIVSHGSRVFCQDVEADHSFVRDVQLRAADLEPFLRRMRRIKLDSLGR